MVEVETESGANAQGSLARASLESLWNCTWAIEQPDTPLSRLNAHLSRQGLLAFRSKILWGRRGLHNGHTWGLLRLLLLAELTEALQGADYFQLVPFQDEIVGVKKIIRGEPQLLAGKDESVEKRSKEFS